MSTAEADAAVTSDLLSLGCLSEPEDIVARWRGVVVRHGVMGKATHDARLVALMLAHGVTRICTLNGADFRRYAEIEIVDPGVVQTLKR